MRAPKVALASFSDTLLFVDIRVKLIAYSPFGKPFMFTVRNTLNGALVPLTRPAGLPLYVAMTVCGALQTAFAACRKPGHALHGVDACVYLRKVGDTLSAIVELPAAFFESSTNPAAFPESLAGLEVEYEGCV